MSTISYHETFNVTSPLVETVKNDNVTSTLAGSVNQIAFQISSFIVICILALSGNFLVAFTLVRKDQLVLPSNRLVFSLTSSNFALALLVFPFAIVSSVHQKWLFGIFWCNFTAFLTVLVASASFLTIAVIAIDRYYAIVKPMMYTLTITNARSSVLLLVVWLLSFLCALPPLFGWSRFVYRHSEAVCLIDWKFNVSYTVFVLIISFLLPLIVMLICYYAIFQVARTKCRKVHVGSVSESYMKVLPQSLPSDSQRSSHHHSLSRKSSWFLFSYASPAKGLRTICIVMGVFIITCLPYVIIGIIEASGQSNILSWYIHMVAIGLAFLSAASHPIVYGLYNRSIRKEIKNLLCSSASRSSRQGSHSTFRRLSISASLMDYSPFKIYRNNRSRRTSYDYSRTSLELLNINSRLKAIHRKDSQDSGAVMTESDFESDNSHRFHRWRRRLSAPSRLQHFTHLFTRYQEMPQQSNSSHPLPILQNLNLKRAQCDLEENASQIYDTSRETVVLETNIDNLDIPSSNSVPGIKASPTENKQENKIEKLFQCSQIHNSANNDEGIVNDCIVEDLE